MEEYKIGETFNIGRKKFQVIESNNCKRYYFQDNTEFCFDLQKYIDNCYSKEREDAKDVCFKLVEE